MLRSPFKAAERLSLSHLQSEVSTLLERLWRFGVNTGPLDGHDLAPAVELREEQDRFVLTAELPGVPLAGLEVTAGPASVTLTGEKPKPQTLGNDDVVSEYPRVVQSERRYGRFSRTISLPGPIQTDGVSAALADGVLTVDLPKLAGVRPAAVRVDIRPATKA